MVLNLLFSNNFITIMSSNPHSNSMRQVQGTISQYLYFCFREWLSDQDYVDSKEQSWDLKLGIQVPEYLDHYAAESQILKNKSEKIS